MRLRHIEIFEAICRTGSWTNAAKILHISQPAASKMLANAELRLGFRLFERVKGRLKPTREAEILAPHVLRLQEELAQVRRLASNLKSSHQGHLRIGSIPAMGLGMLPASIRKNKMLHPQVTFELRTHHSHELVQSLMARDLDMVLTFDQTNYPGVERRVIGHTELVHVGLNSHSGPISLHDMQAREYIALETRDPSGSLLEKALEAQGVKLNVVIQVQTHYVACSLVAAGCGETIVDLITAKAMLRPGLVISRVVPQIHIPISIMTRAADPLSISHEMLADLLASSCQDYRLDDAEDKLVG